MEKLKDLYRPDRLKELVKEMESHLPSFYGERFLQQLEQEEDWESLSLRQRHGILARAFYESMGLDFPQLARGLQELGRQVQGFRYLFLPDIVSLYGLDDVQKSLATLEVLTESSSAEFAIREFLKKDFQVTFKQMQHWSLSSNEHHRRLASEGLRPNLPWGKKVPAILEHRDEIWALLEQLKGDTSLYVRKSVANHLHDWTHTYPGEVLDLLESWQGQTEETDWIVKRASRTLLKKGNPRALALFGYDSQLEVAEVSFDVPTRVEKGQKMEVTYDLKLAEAAPLRLDLQMDFQKPSGRVGTSRFILKDRQENELKTITGRWGYEWLDKSTRKHADGQHKWRLYLNGHLLEEGEIEVTGFLDKKS